jgi:phosphate starvation-inducible PhoH-like protein
VEIVARVEGISFVYFNERDVVRHSLVQRIIRAYEEHENAKAEAGTPRAQPPAVSESSKS